VVAVLVSSAGFGAPHPRRIEAGPAGIEFALMPLRRGNVTSAVQAHVVANGLIAVVAVRRGGFGLI